MFCFKKRQENQKPTGRVVVLIDYDNIYLGTRDAGKAFPVQELQELGRKYGVAETPIVFLSHLTHHDIIMALGRRGFYLNICPPAKCGGRDTVDERIHEECRRLADHPQIATFILVSNDSDFNRTEELLRNHHKRIIRFAIDERCRALKSADGDAIELTDYQPVQVQEELPQVRNDFSGIIQRMKAGQIDFYDESRVGLIRQVIAACAKISRLDQEKRSFMMLLSFVWNLIYMDARRLGFSRNDCHDVLDALLKHTDVLERHWQDGSPRNYYVYKASHNLSL